MLKAKDSGAWYTPSINGSMLAVVNPVNCVLKVKAAVEPSPVVANNSSNGNFRADKSSPLIPA